MAYTITFDGAQRLIEINSTDAVNEVPGIEIYSEWKRWVHEDEGALWEPAFLDSIGGQPVSSTQTVASYWFVNNAAGWRILPPDLDGELKILGNVYPADPNIEIKTSRPGRTMTVSFDRAAAAQTATAGLTEPDIIALVNGVWNAPTGDHLLPGSTGKRAEDTAGDASDAATLSA